MSFWVFLHLHPVQGWIILSMAGVNVILAIVAFGSSRKQAVEDVLDSLLKNIREKERNLEELKARGKEKERK